MKTKLLLTALLSAGLGLPVASGAIVSGQQNQLSNTTSARQSRQQADRQSRLDYLLAPIKSAADLTRYLSSHASGTSPLDSLSPAARQRFLSSLVFTDRGLASFDYQDLVKELTPTEIYRVLSLFGAQQLVGEFTHAKVRTEADRLLLARQPYLKCLKGWYCESHGTCAKGTPDVCCNLNTC